MEKSRGQKAAELVLGEPVGFEMSDSASKLKRNLLLAACVVIVLVVGEIKTSDKLSIFGVSLEGVTPEKLMVGLSIVLSYSLIHYLWYCYEGYGEWCLRITGTRVAFNTGGHMERSVDADYPTNPKQSTLYSWWLQEARQEYKHSEKLSLIEQKLKEINDNILVLSNAVDDNRINQVIRDVTDLTATTAKLNGELHNFSSLLKRDRILVSLGRFDRRFYLLLCSQNIRVILVDIVVPLLVAFYAAYLILVFFGFFAYVEQFIMML